MFKRSLLSITLLGLISGSVHADEGRQSIKENVAALRRSFYSAAELHAMLGATSAVVAGAIALFSPLCDFFMAFEKPYSWEWSLMTTEQQLDFYVKATEKMHKYLKLDFLITAGATLFALYNVYKFCQNNERAEALENIESEITPESLCSNTFYL